MFVIVRYSSNREIIKLGESKNIEDAQKIMTDDFKELFYETYGYEMKQNNTSFETKYEIAADNDQCALESDSAWLNNHTHDDTNYDWAIIAVNA